MEIHINVVPYQYSTSNRNSIPSWYTQLLLFLINILHQTATYDVVCKLCWVVPYQYSTSNRNDNICYMRSLSVVPYQYSTSNRNSNEDNQVHDTVVPYQYSTSNRNRRCLQRRLFSVVPYQYSTSNRNVAGTVFFQMLLFLINILHQTATLACRKLSLLSCSLSIFYIKPQLWMMSFMAQTLLFLINILHQTATNWRILFIVSVLFLINILHQTATIPTTHFPSRGCSLSIFYIKPQLNIQCFVL